MGTEQPTRVSLAGRPTFFSAADEAIADVLGQQGFESSLLLNFLFGKDLVLHEAYFFNSSLLLTHVRNAGNGGSLFEVAAQEGIVRPAFRFSDVTNLETALQRMREVYDRPNLPRVLTAAHRRVIRASRAGLDKVAPVYADIGSLGEGYQRAMEAYFQPKEPPPGTSNAHWAAMGEWRSLIPEACNLTASRQQSGLQRSELVRSVCRALGLPEDVSYLPLEILAERCGCPERANALRTFWTRMNQIHWMNIGRGYQLSTSVPALEINLNEDPEREAEARTVGRGLAFFHEVQVPSIGVLLTMPPERLLELRQGPGRNYRQLLWEPAADAEDIRFALDEYSNRLRKIAPEGAPSMIRYAPVAKKLCEAATTLGAVAQAVKYFLPEPLNGPTGAAVDIGLAGIAIFGAGISVASSMIVSRTTPHQVEFVCE